MMPPSDESVHYLVSGHMKQDLEGSIGQIAAVTGIELDPELVEILFEHASLPFK
jgi:hypothetical protein